jgi:hypothetical protein
MYKEEAVGRNRVGAVYYFEGEAVAFPCGIHMQLWLSLFLLEKAIADDSDSSSSAAASSQSWRK